MATSNNEFGHIDRSDWAEDVPLTDENDELIGVMIIRKAVFNAESFPNIRYIESGLYLNFADVD